MELNILDRVKEWDKAAGKYDQWFRTKFGSYIFRIELEMLRRALRRDGKIGRFLDVGCGTGLFTVSVAEDDFEKVGIDTSQNMAARAKGRGVEVIVADAHHLPLKNKVFDAVMLFTTLEFLNEESALREVHRVLTVGGDAVVGVHNLLNSWNLYRKIRARFKKKSFYKSIRYYSPRRLTDILGSNGFHVKSISSSFFLPCLIKLPFIGKIVKAFEGRTNFKQLGAIIIVEAIRIE